MRGLRAKRALENLERFISSIGDVSWLPDTYVGSPDALRCHLERLALKAKQAVLSILLGDYFEETYTRLYRPATRSSARGELHHRKTSTRSSLISVL